MTLVYKILTVDERARLEADGLFRGSADDLRDGFIHLSAAPQVAGTWARHFAGRPGLSILAIDADRLGAALRWEASRGGEPFPHLYGPLVADAVVDAVALELDPAGRPRLPA